jgi:predicted Zn-dependent protease
MEGEQKSQPRFRFTGLAAKNINATIIIIFIPGGASFFRRGLIHTDYS